MFGEFNYWEEERSEILSHRMNRHAEEKIGPPATPYNSNFWRTSKKSKSELSGDQLNCGEEEIKQRVMIIQTQISKKVGRSRWAI